jgi:acyl-coenzyme A thioesterase PaaI-like protein
MPSPRGGTALMHAPLEQMRRLHAATHPHCVVCGADNARGLQVNFRPMADGGVEAHFDCARIFEGYSHRIHGGVIAALLDGAMTNCLFAHGHVAVTAELNLRYRHPVMTDRRATVRAWIRESSHRLHRLRAELLQDGQLLVIATATFLNATDGDPDLTGASAG